MKKRKITGAVFMLLPLASLFIFYSCYYDYGLDTNNLDVVGTFYDKNYDFSGVSTYFLADSIVHTSGDGQYDAQVLSKVEDELNSLGWTRLCEGLGCNDTADVMVLIGATSSTTTTYYTNYWDYWGWYGGWGYYPSYGYGSGWGWSYPSYSTSSYTYTTGSLVITLTDPRTGNTSAQELPVQWLCIINGLLDGNNISGRINTSLSQAFTQSPYLR